MSDTNPKPNEGDKGGTPTQPTTPEPTTPTTPAPTGDFDPTKISDDQFAKVFDDPRTFQHPRFKELNDRAKEADKLKKEKQEAAEKKLEEEGEYKKLAEERQAEIERLKSETQTAQVNTQLTAELIKAGCIDVNAALKLITRDGIKVGDDGTIEGVEASVTSLKTASSYLFGTTQPVGSGTNPTDGAGTTPPNTFYRSQLQDQAFYKAHEKEILEAHAAGRVIDDITDPSKRPQ